MKNEESLSTKLWLEERINMLQGIHESAQPHKHKFHLNTTQLKNLTKYLKNKKFSLETITHAAWGLLLNRLSTTESVLLGSGIIAIKPKQTTMSNSIKPIESQINASMTVKQFLTAIDKQLCAKKHKHNDLISEIRYPCFLESKSAGKSSQPLNLEQYKFSLIYKKSEPGKFTFIFHPGYFSKESIKRLQNYFIEIFSNLLHDQSGLVTDVNMMSVNEKELILNEWSRPEYSFATVKLSECTHDLITEIARKHPDKLAIEHNGDEVNFATLEQEAENLAMVLIEHGVKPKDTIAVMMERTPAHIIAMLAIFKAGAIFTSINPKYPHERIEFVLDDSKTSCILTNSASKVPEKFSEKILLLPLNWKELPRAKSRQPLPQSCGKSVAYMIYTSGTTGKPKGVMINHESITNLTSWYRNCFQMTLSDRSSQFASQGFDTYICETVPVLACGASVHIVDDNIKLTPNLFFDWLISQKITLCDLPTSYAQMLFTLPWPNEITLRMMKIGGESCTRYPEKNFSFDIWNCYGPTETTVEATYYKMHQANNKPAPVMQYKTPSIGKISANGETYVVDKYLQPVPVGVAGELLIGGVCVSPGYFNRSDLSKTKFIDNTFSPASPHKLYRTGDLVSWLPDGNLAFIGRIDNQIKIHGYRIELGDIESAISKYPDVREVAVIAKEMPNGEKSIIAYVVPNLDKERYLYQERCLISIDDSNFIEAITEDISKYGIALSGVSEKIPVAKKVKIHLKLPGFNTSKNISARLIWQIEERCGFVFDLSEEEQKITEKSIDYFLASHNIMDLVLSSSAKRSLRKAIKKKLPEYMVPSTFVTLTEFPLTFSGKVDLKALPPPSDYEEILRKHFVPAKTETEKKMTAIWESLLNRKQIGMEDNFFDLGGNSLKAAELSVKIMDHFNTSIPAKILFDLSYIPILSEYIDSKGEHYSTQTVLQDEISRDSALAENIVPTGRLSPTIRDPQNILLTGAGGFLGIFMLSELLKSSNAKIHCIIRNGEFESAARRINATIKKFGLENTVSLANRRIVAISGDLAQNHFGMPLELYENLAGKIDLIYHCGAQVNIMASYNKLRGSNVQGTQEIIKFATHIHDKPIHYISTLSAAYLKDESGALSEEFPSEMFQDLFGGYAISKWASERLLTDLKDRGCPVAIYRSGYIAGDSKSGLTSLNDALLMLIKGCIELGYAPDMKEKITILPVDFVSEAIVKLSFASPDFSRTLHIDHPTGIMWADLIAWLNNYGYNIKITSLENWKVMLRTINQSNALYPFLPYYLALPNNYCPPEVRTDKTSEALIKIGLEYPAIDDDLLNTYFDYLCKDGFFTTPAKKKSRA